jgi:hypothetical protein
LKGNNYCLYNLGVYIIIAIRIIMIIVILSKVAKHPCVVKLNDII